MTKLAIIDTNPSFVEPGLMARAVNLSDTPEGESDRQNVL